MQKNNEIKSKNTNDMRRNHIYNEGETENETNLQKLRKK